MKKASDYLSAAHEKVPKIEPKDAIAKHGGSAVFIDVRDSADITKSGTIAGALRIPRGFLEFAACEGTPHKNAALNKDSEIILVCGAGGQAALAGHTLHEMGYSNVSNVGGIGDWKDAGGPTES